MARLFSTAFLLAATSALSFGAVDSGLVSLLPSGTRLVVSVNAQEARGSDFGQFLLRDQRWNDARFQEMISMTGFDPRRDLQTIVVAAAGPVPQEDTSRQHGGKFAVLARGNFDAPKIGAAALQHGSTLQKMNGVDVYVSPDGGRSQHGFAFVDVDVAALADLGSLREIIANRSNPSHFTPEFEQLLNKASTDRDVWFASAGMADHFAAALGPDAPSQSSQILRSIVRSSGGIKLGKVVQFSFDATARSDKDAVALGDVIRFLASAVQMNRDQNPRASVLAPALENLNLTTSGNEVHVTTSVPESVLEQMAPKLRAGAEMRR